MIRLPPLTPPPPPYKLIKFYREPLPITGCVRLPFKINQLQVFHNFIVVDRLVAPVIILGLDFLQQYTLVLNLAFTPVMMQPFTGDTKLDQLYLNSCNLYGQVLQRVRCSTSKMKHTGSVLEEPSNVMDEYVIPCFASATTYNMPESTRPCFQSVVKQFKPLFITKPGKAYHYIPTSGTPVKVPPRRIPAHY